MLPPGVPGVPLTNCQITYFLPQDLSPLDKFDQNLFSGFISERFKNLIIEFRMDTYLCKWFAQSYRGLNELMRKCEEGLMLWRPLDRKW